MNARTLRVPLAALSAVAAVLVTFALAAQLTPQRTGVATAPTDAPHSAVSAAVARAAALPIIDETVEVPDYRRDSFGERWADIDANGCNQRQDVLARDLDDITRDGCTVLTGTLRDPYTGTVIAFQHDRVAQPGNSGSQGVQIDHIVSLSAAHDGGAWAWTEVERERFANTLDLLLAVDGTTNQAKGDRGPSLWMPPNVEFACEYARRYTEIVSEWHLSVTSQDRDALVATLGDCPSS